MDRSTLNKVFVWGVIFAKLRDRSSPLSELELELLKLSRDTHFWRAIAILKFLNKRSAPTSSKLIARRLRFNQQVTREFLRSFEAGGFTLQNEDGLYEFKVNSDRMLGMILEQSDRA